MREWLRTARKSKGLTMKALASELGISESFYCAIENGHKKKDMSASIALGLSEALGIPVRDVLEMDRKSMEAEKHAD